jgi:hypothetical protein
MEIPATKSSSIATAGLVRSRIHRIVPDKKAKSRWFDKHDLPVCVAWWVDADHAIDWAEGCERIDRLHHDGPTAHAFNFTKPFDSQGKSCVLDREKVKAKAEMNAKG